MASAVRAMVCLTLCLAVCQVKGSYNPAKMNRTLKSLLQHYKIPNSVRLNSQPVFSREPLNGRMEVQKVFMGSVLETYEKLLTHMINQLPTPSPKTTDLPTSGTSNDVVTDSTEDLREKLSYVLEKVRDLKKFQFREQEELLKNLQALKHIKMDNPVVQSKALGELPWLYDLASSLSENSSKRRRRQARRAKNHSRG